MPDSGSAVQSLFRVGENCCAVARADRVAFLVDGEAYFDAFVRAAEGAQRSLMILAWDFDSRTALRYDAQGKPTLLLGDFLNDLAKRNPKLHIRVLDWDYPMIFGTDREFPPIYGLDWKPHRRIDFRFDDTHPLAGSHHQKIVVIDDRMAFAGGLDLTNKRWDSSEHRPDDPRRTFEGQPYPPFHDAMVAVDGAAAEALAGIARGRWHRATGDTLERVRVDADPWPADLRPELRDVPLSVACTLPPEPGEEKGVNHVEQLYLDMIAAARKYVYIENQYFTSQKIADALRARLAEPEGPEIVLVTRLLSHGWLEEVTMHALRTRLVRELREADRQGRFHAYYPHVDGLCEGTCIDLHSKVMIVDDEWLRIGSSNLSNRSMGLDSECDVTIEARGKAPVAEVVRGFRDRLLAEHAGCPAEQLAGAVRQHGGMAAAIESLPKPPRRLERLDAPELSETALNVASIADSEKPLPLDKLVRGFAHEEKPVKPLPPGVKIVASLVAVFLVMGCAWRFTPLASVVTPDRVIGFFDEFSRYWWAPLLVLAAYTPASFVMFPRPLITMAAVVAFGPWEGLSYAMAGVVLAAVAGYAVGRTVHRDTVRRLAGPQLNRLSAVLPRRGIVAVMLVRLVPIAPYAVVNMVMGAMRIRLRHFVAGTFLGMLPGGLAATVLSEQVATALRDPSLLNGWMIGAAVAGFAALAYFGQRMLRRMDRDGSDGGTPPHALS